MRYIKPALKVDRFTVEDSILAEELSSNDFPGGGTGGFTPADDSNAPGGNGGFGYEVIQDAFDIIIGG